MERADFIHLVRLSEHASAADSQAYRRSVAAFAALGYAWVIGCLLLAVTLLAWTIGLMLRGQFKGFYIGLLLAAAGVLWTSLRALWCRLDEPQGVPLLPADAPALFEALERIRKKIKGPPIYRVLLDANFNASIRATACSAVPSITSALACPCCWRWTGRAFLPCWLMNTATCAATMAVLPPGFTAPA